MREFQRQKVYDAEFSARAKLTGKAHEIARGSFDELKAQRQAEEMAQFLRDEHHWQVTDPKVEFASRKSYTINGSAWWASGRIRLQRTARFDTLMHEVAHLASGDTSVPGHGVEFAAVLSQLWEEYLGTRAADDLEYMYGVKGVVYDHGDPKRRSYMRTRVRWLVNDGNRGGYKTRLYLVMRPALLEGKIFQLRKFGQAASVNDAGVIFESKGGFPPHSPDMIAYDDIAYAERT